MYLIAGLGNPGRDYVDTRHNIGFEVIDFLAAKLNTDINKTKSRALIGKGKLGGEKVILAKPQTYMNLSGESIRELLAWYKIDTDHLIVIYDDISLPTGKLRIRPQGSDGGHNGIKNIIFQLKTDVFPRIKVGIAPPFNNKADIKDYVLGKLSREETDVLIPAARTACEAIEDIIKNGTAHAMNRYN